MTPPGKSSFDVTTMRNHAGDAAQLLKALANENRLQVLCLLAEGERSVGDINALREEGLVQTRREAQTIYYALAPGPAEAVMHTLHGIYCAPARGGKTRGK